MPDVPTYCAKCGIEIPPERIEAVPGTTLCVICQSGAEIKKNEPVDSTATGEYCPLCAVKGIKSKLVWRRRRDGTSKDDFLGCIQYGQIPNCMFSAGPKSKTLNETEIDELIAEAKDSQILDQMKKPENESAEHESDEGGIKVYEDESFYYVHVTIDQRNRAKKIKGRSWKPSMKAWKYPKTIETFEAICNEFKLDAVRFDISPPKVVEALQDKKKLDEPTSKSSNNISENIEDEENDSTEESDIQDASALEEDEEETEYYEPVTKDDFLDQQSKIAQYHQELQKHSEDVESSVEKLWKQIDILESKIESLPVALSQSIGETLSKFENYSAEQAYEEKLRELLSSIVNKNSKFESEIRKLSLTRDTLLALCNLERALKKELRSLLQVDLDQEIMSLHDLLKEAYDTKSISSEVKDHLHNFRKYRNDLIHKDQSMSSSNFNEKVFAKFSIAIYSLALAWEIFED